ncbi:MAG: LysR family transcriptional regulator [Arcobacter sp.]|uniref:LysR family transcriptional regulator n=1 Tax=uncultured Arcobacter sp. TaxID=165434 RepID=UPI000CC2F0E7|nr:LysR substrate-binding domain-containing protein [uncultured Arcobacter sp.]PLY08546.1 MAG: LysR family transcriptional regulator [Arcobacter sp.]
MDFNLLKIFLEVSKQKSISKAANTLKFAQSNVTSRIKQLEKDLGYKLFHRVPKGVILTNEGDRLLPHALEIVNKVELATLDMKNMVNQEQLIVASTESNAVTRIVDFLLKLHKDYSNMQLELITNTTKDVTKMLLDYQVDIAFISGVPKHDELLVLNKVDEKLVIVEPKDSFVPEVFLSFKKGCAYNEFGQNYLFETTGIEHKKLEFGSYETILGCVKAGMGKSILPISIVKRLRYEDELKITNLPNEIANMPTCLVCRKDYIPKIASYLKSVKL